MEEKRICESNLNSCPCKVIDTKKDVAYCNFIKKFSESLISDKEKNTKDTNFFLKRVCSDVR